MNAIAIYELSGANVPPAERVLTDDDRDLALRVARTFCPGFHYLSQILSDDDGRQVLWDCRLGWAKE